jgi:hypothetical protein
MNPTLRISRVGFQSAVDREATPNNVQGCSMKEQERFFYGCGVNFAIWDSGSFAIVLLASQRTIAHPNTRTADGRMPLRSAPLFVHARGNCWLYQAKDNPYDHAIAADSLLAEGKPQPSRA